jgi:hypothetical protein
MKGWAQVLKQKTYSQIAHTFDRSDIFLSGFPREHFAKVAGLEIAWHLILCQQAQGDSGAPDANGEKSRGSGKRRLSKDSPPFPFLDFN